MTNTTVQKMVVEKAWRREWAVHWIVEYLHLGHVAWDQPMSFSLTLPDLCKSGLCTAGNEISVPKRIPCQTPPSKWCTRGGIRYPLLLRNMLFPAQRCCLASLEHWWAKHTPPLLMSPWHTAFYLRSETDKLGMGMPLECMDDMLISTVMKRSGKAFVFLTWNKSWCDLKR